MWKLFNTTTTYVACTEVSSDTEIDEMGKNRDKSINETSVSPISID